MKKPASVTANRTPVCDFGKLVGELNSVLTDLQQLAADKSMQISLQHCQLFTARGLSTVGDASDVMTRLIGCRHQPGLDELTIGKIDTGISIARRLVRYKGRKAHTAE